MRWLSKLLTLPIRFYRRFISPFLPQTCRYYPTCSQYSIEALERYGPFWGTLKSVARILRCHPLFPGGYDPVEKGWPRVRENKRK